MDPRFVITVSNALAKHAMSKKGTHHLRCLMLGLESLDLSNNNIAVDSRYYSMLSLGSARLQALIHRHGYAAVHSRLLVSRLCQVPHCLNPHIVA